MSTSAPELPAVFESQIDHNDLQVGQVKAQNVLIGMIGLCKNLNRPDLKGYAESMVAFYEQREPTNPLIRYYKLVIYFAANFNVLYLNDPAIKAILEAGEREDFLDEVAG